jgi:hypothetical protein
LPTPWPRHWLNPDRSGAVTRFTDSRFDGDSTPALVQSLFGRMCRIDVNPMSLRSIFVALTKARREEAN